MKSTQVLLALILGVSTCFSQLTQQERAQFVNNGVDVTSLGPLNWQFAHSGLPSQDVVDQFPLPGDRNGVLQQDYEFRIPKDPEVLEEPECLPMGPIAMTVKGVVFYNPYAMNGEDAVETETMGKCNGHPDGQGRYHHHGINNCTYQGRPNELLGVAFDGYPIYGPRDANDELVTEDDLDECHGQIVDELGGRYVYRVTYNFPYVLGCFRGYPENVRVGRCPYALKDPAYMEKMQKTLDEMDALKEEEDALRKKRNKIRNKLRRVINEGFMSEMV